MVSRLLLPCCKGSNCRSGCDYRRPQRCAEPKDRITRSLLKKLPGYDHLLMRCSRIWADGLGGTGPGGLAGAWSAAAAWWLACPGGLTAAGAVSRVRSGGQDPGAVAAGQALADEVAQVEGGGAPLEPGVVL